MNKNSCSLMQLWDLFRLMTVFVRFHRRCLTMKSNSTLFFLVVFVCPKTKTFFLMQYVECTTLNTKFNVRILKSIKKNENWMFIFLSLAYCLCFVVGCSWMVLYCQPEQYNVSFVVLNLQQYSNEREEAKKWIH